MKCSYGFIKEPKYSKTCAELIFSGFVQPYDKKILNPRERHPVV
jgi:hypothetical protein